MAQISIPKDQLQSVIDKITQEGGKLTKSCISQNMKEVTLIYTPGEAIDERTKQMNTVESSPVMINGPEGLKEITGTVLSKPESPQPLITPDPKIIKSSK